MNKLLFLPCWSGLADTGWHGDTINRSKWDATRNIISLVHLSYPNQRWHYEYLTWIISPQEHIQNSFWTFESAATQKAKFKCFLRRGVRKTVSINLHTICTGKNVVLESEKCFGAVLCVGGFVRPGEYCPLCGLRRTWGWNWSTLRPRRIDSVVLENDIIYMHQSNSRMLP